MTTPPGYAFCERWPTCMELCDTIILCKALGIGIRELSDAFEEYMDELMRLGFK